MVILVKIVKKGFIQMVVESRESTMHSDLKTKNSFWKVSSGGYPLKKIH
jgi:hypothetical protein